ncbi:MAG: high frequency lysogenization protein HflD [Nitrosopumilaceae archaeon]|jgi:hypothetical protein
MGLGLTVGMQHAFEPDHIAAVSTQISKSTFSQKSIIQTLKESFTKSSVIGVLWGAGHTTTLVLIGFLVYVLAISIQNQIFSGLEFAVGIMLTFLGMTTILNKKFRLRHRHPHQHKDGTIHFDEHSHSDSEHDHNHRSYYIGLVHGLAGSGSLVVFTAATLDNVGMVLGFIGIFGIGSIIGMIMVGSLMGIPLVFANKIKTIQKAFRYAAGAFSLIIGTNIMFQIGISGHLFGL